MKNIVVFYHGSCTDGFGGAYAAWKKFGSRAEYVPLEHGRPLSVFPQKKEVYFIDIVASEPELMSLIRANRRVTAIDHHITQEKLVKRTQDYLYALNHSGATLAWRYFHKNKKMPRLLLHIEDDDLFKFKVSHTREICAMLELLPYDFKIWDNFAKQLDNLNKRKQIIEKGAHLLSYNNILISDIIESTASHVLFQGVKTYAVNSPIFKDEIGHRLYTKHPPMAIIWSERKDKRKVSLRSVPSFDVSKLAQKISGGGGLKNAAGFTMDLKKPLPWKRL